MEGKKGGKEGGAWEGEFYTRHVDGRRWGLNNLEDYGWCLTCWKRTFLTGTSMGQGSEAREILKYLNMTVVQRKHRQMVGRMMEIHIRVKNNLP